eukprot:GFUD01066235.1.p1 GENE.GFUD01066235.1~~GFUD01066235.1.p1  ORF type:complete len:121 (+),score=12.96 GFUD01066235.1:52-414(+)
MRNHFSTMFFICQFYISYQRSLNRQPAGKHINILEPEANLQIEQMYLENRINTLFLESLLVKSLIKESSRKRRSLRSRNPRRKSSDTLDVQTEDNISKLTRKQHRRRGNKGDLVPFPRVG